jgi:hypothetical protein
VWPTGYDQSGHVVSTKENKHKTIGLDYGPKINSICPIARWLSFSIHVIQIKDLAENERRRRHTQTASPSPEGVTAHTW